MTTDTQIITAEHRPSITENELVDIAERIRRTTEDIIKTGHDLIQVKARLEHGQFHEWIETKCGMTDRAARNYMQAARWAEGKPETISDLPPTTIYALASPSTTKEIQNRVVADLEAGKKINVYEVSKRIKMARSEQQIKRKEDLQKQARNRKRSAKYQRHREQEKTEHEARQKRVKEAVQEACSILLKLDTPDLDRLVELLDTIHNGWGLERLPQALSHAMRSAEA